MCNALLSCSCFFLLYYLTWCLIFTFLQHSPLNLSHPVQTLKMNHMASIKIKVQQPAKSSNTENYTWHKPSIYLQRIQLNNLSLQQTRHMTWVLSHCFSKVLLRYCIRHYHMCLKVWSYSDFKSSRQHTSAAIECNANFGEDLFQLIFFFHT